MLQFTLCLMLMSVREVSSLTDVTEKIFGNNNQGIIAAFGDFNADKHTDLFVISQDGSSVYVYLADNEEAYSEHVLLDNTTLAGDIKVSSVVPADFDGDLQMDVLVTLKNKSRSDGFVSLKIFWGQGSKLDSKSPLTLPDMVDQPLLLDENADMVPDLMGEKAVGERYYWIFSRDRNYTERKLVGGEVGDKHPPLRVPQSSAFVDMNNDLTADLIIVSMANDSMPQLEFWLNEKGTLTWTEKQNIKLIYEKDLKVVGQFTFADIDGDLMTDILVPVCVDADCAQSLILLYHKNKWISLPVGLYNAGLKWNFIPPDKTGAPSHMLVPITLRVGDFNLDGFPDLLAVLGNATGNLHRAVILKNEPCHSGCDGFPRTFSVNWDIWLEGSTDKALLPAFYDVYDNGILDVIVTSIQSQGSAKIGVLQHLFMDDACFIKVTVVSGLCNYDCPGKRQPYGVNQPGPVITYRTTDVKGDPQHRTATQLSQSAYFPLQLPYSIFGLGQIPNFIDTLEVGIPTNTSTQLNKGWSSVIPNSQLLVIPYPINKPSSWTNKLFVTPSRLMMLTGAALLGTCGFIAGIVGILHWRDKIEDRKEKRQEAQKFHFDAM